MPCHMIGLCMRIWLAESRFNGFWHDSHSTAVHSEVFELFGRLSQKAAIDCIIIERDANYTTAQHDLINDIQQARRLWSPAI